MPSNVTSSFASTISVDTYKREESIVESLVSLHADGSVSAFENKNESEAEFMERNHTIKRAGGSIYNKNKDTSVV